MTIGGSTAAAELASLVPWGDPAPRITAAERAGRLDRMRALTAEAGADALLIGAGASLRYFAGVPWGASERLVALVLPVEGDPVIVCPRFEEGSLLAALEIPADVRLWEEDESPSALVAAGLRGGATLLVDPQLPFGMATALGACGLVLRDASGVVDACRMLKSPAELALLSQAKAMTLEVQRRAAAILEPASRRVR